MWFECLCKINTLHVLQYLVGTTVGICVGLLIGMDDGATVGLEVGAEVGSDDRKVSKFC